jgi:predicted DNA-binding transcriptional regulator AlpA
MKDTESDYMDVKGVAKRLGVSCSLLHKLKRNGSGPTFRRFGRSIRYAVADVDSWSNERAWRSVRVQMSPNNSPDTT